MAKRKKRKNDGKKKPSYQIELMGLALIIITILGFGRFGPVGEAISAFGAFLVGVWYNVLLLGVMITGIYMVIKREKPDFLTSKLIGIYILAIGILIFSHIGYIEKNELELAQIFKETIDNFMASTKVISNIQGGGILGAGFAWAFVSLFELKGTKIVVWAMLICGVIMFTGMSIYDMLSSAKEKTKDMLHRPKKEKNEKERKPLIHSSDDEDGKIVVSSVDELIHSSDDKIAEQNKNVNTEVKEEIIDNKGYIYPPISLLKKQVKNKNNDNHAAIKDNIPLL